MSNDYAAYVFYFDYLFTESIVFLKNVLFQQRFQQTIAYYNNTKEEKITKCQQDTFQCHLYLLPTTTYAQS